MSVYKYNETQGDTGIIDTMVNTGHLSSPSIEKSIPNEARDQLNALQQKTNKELDPDKVIDPQLQEQIRDLQHLSYLVAAREFIRQQSGVPGQEAWAAIMKTLPAAHVDIPANYYELDATIKANPTLKASWDKLYPAALESVKSNGVINQLIARLRSERGAKSPVPRQYFNLNSFKVAQIAVPKFPVKGFGDFIDKFLGDIMAFDGTGQQGDLVSNSAIKEIQSAVGQGFEAEANSVLEAIRQLSENERDKAEEMMRVIYSKWLSPNVKANDSDNIGLTTMSESAPKGIIKFNLTDHVLNNKGEVVKTAASQFGNEYFLYGPTEKRICPKLRGKFGGSGTGNDVVSEYICRHHCLDGIVIDDNKTICGEALWRANVMDKFSREYVDADGNIIGGYLNNRFEINRNVPEENKMRLKPGETRKPRPAAWGNMESRLQDMRNKEAEDRNYRPDSDKSKPFNWTKDVDQNNVEVDQAERNRRETAAGHKIVEYTNRDQGENNPKVVTASTDEGNAVGKWDGGWLNGEWKCPNCGTIIGKNLKDEQPHALVQQHKAKCGKKATSFNFRAYKTAGFETPIEESHEDQEYSKALERAGGETFSIEPNEESFPPQNIIDELQAWALEPEDENPQFLPAYKLWGRWSRGVPADPQLVQEAIQELQGLITDQDIQLGEDDKESLTRLISDLSPYTEKPTPEGPKPGMQDSETNPQAYRPPVAASTKEAKSPPGWGGTVEKMKEHHPDKFDEDATGEGDKMNPFAIAWHMKNKGDEPHYTESGEKKEKFKDEDDDDKEDKEDKKDKKEDKEDKKEDKKSFNLNQYKEAKEKGTTYKGKHYDVNPWAVCHTTVDKDEDPEKYERCVHDVKGKSMEKEDKEDEKKK